MRLKQIKLAGFKSFVDPTKVPFPGDMTAVVGPNGCGKSNIIDAVRWVLGESSAKNLRGDAMTDVIFNGSTSRKPVSQASVELFFDNSEGRVSGAFANYSEISVRRLVTRDATSTYFLNGNKCRRRDITDLFLGTGLGPRSYAIIEQGMISRLIESKPQELRVFIEEAAGISKYKERRRETENRLRHTRDNLERLSDVRNELGQQLEKLQRQAAAAKRFKELKARERKLKAELAALRWYRLNEHINELEATLNQQQTELEAYVAEQRGSESGLITLKEREADLKQAQEDARKQLFVSANRIARLEEGIQHTQQSRLRLEQQQRQLADAQAEASQFLSQQREEQQQLEQELEAIAEEAEIAAETQLESEQRLEQAEQQLANLRQRWDQVVRSRADTQHRFDACAHAIQTLNTHLSRTELRIRELGEELALLDVSALTQEIEALAQSELELKAQSTSVLVKQEQAQEQLLSAEQQSQQRQQARQQCQIELTRFEAQLAAVDNSLNKLKQRQGVDQAFAALPLISDQLEVAAGWERAVQAVLGGKLTGVILEQLQTELPPGEFAIIPGQLAAKAGTLAEKLRCELPLASLLNRVLIAENDQQAWAMQSSLASEQSVISPSGLWLGSCWQQNGPAEAAGQGLLEQEAERRHLLQKVEYSRLQLEQSQAASDQSQQALAEQREQLQQLQSKANQQQQELTGVSQRLEFARSQLQQQQARRSRVSEELEQCQQQLEHDQQQREEQQLRQEELAMALEQVDEGTTELQSEIEQATTGLAQQRTEMESARQRAHSAALQKGSVHTRLTTMQQGFVRAQQQLSELAERQQQVAEELLESEMPLQESQMELEQLLTEKLEQETQVAQISDQLAETETAIKDEESGRHHIVQRIESMRSNLESTRLDTEGYRVRARSVLEQLQEMDQPLKPLLNEMPAQANEESWQQELEKAGRSIARLGAINLAAIEEFESQSERKHYLDEQNADLEGALETLEAAIRKIDRETRSRFKTTYEQVNDDLQTLFPKVFGGGSAYLELTDADLLETGVTIMARPPGKKNSTIHLLSGGEKALTALSLVFAIFRLNPAPFCMLDEVDAPLDDANVGRFCKLVQEMSASVQFVFISHNKVSMEMASHLTGVTMHEPGVSRMVAVDIDEAVALAEAG